MIMLCLAWQYSSDVVVVWPQRLSPLRECSGRLTATSSNTGHQPSDLLTAVHMFATLWYLLWYNVISMASSDAIMLAPTRIFQAAYR
jgi:hypothetical protein